MKNTNTKLKDKAQTPRDKKFKGPKRSKYVKNARSQAHKPIHPKFKDMLNHLNEKTIVMPKKDPTQAFKEKHSEKLYSDRNFGYIDSYVLLKPGMLVDIICNPMRHINKIPRVRQKPSLKDYSDQAAICIFKALWLKEMPFNEILPEARSVWEGSSQQDEIDITCQKTRRLYNEILTKGLKASHLTEKEQADLIRLLDQFIFEYSFAYSRQFRKLEKETRHSWWVLSCLQLF